MTGFISREIEYHTIPIIDITEDILLLSQKYYQAINVWKEKINLMSSNIDYDGFLNQHFVDSAMAINVIDKNAKVVDIGTGCGFPGMVLAILGFYDITLLESNSKKVAFLRNIANLFNVKPNIVNIRAESYFNQIKDYDGYIVSRAVTSMKQISNWSQKKITKSAKFLLYKKIHQVQCEVYEILSLYKFIKVQVYKYSKEKCLLLISV